MPLIDEKLLLKDWKTYCSLIADAYDKLQDYNPSVLSHWIALNKSNHQWFSKLSKEVNIIFVSENKKYEGKPSKINIDGRSFPLEYYPSQPYNSQPQMKADYQNNKRLLISIDYSDHPYFTVIDNIVFRLVHDYLIHIKGNFSFETGEINSYNLHARLAPKEAVPAIFTEVVGQACYVLARGTFPSKQKIDVFKGFDFYNLGKVDDYVINNKELAPATSDSNQQTQQQNITKVTTPISVDNKEKSVVGQQPEPLKEKEMKKTKVIISEQQFTKVLQYKLQENRVDELFNMPVNGGNPVGAVEMSKQDATNTTNVQKYTNKGIDVKVMAEDEKALEETLGDVHEVTMRHKYSEGCLNLYSTKEAVSLREVLNYVNGLKDQPMVEDSFNNEKVNLYVKIPASGRYKHLGGFSKDALSRFRAIADKEAVTGVQSEALNEALAEPVK